MPPTPGRQIDHPAAFGHRELAEQEIGIARLQCHPVRVAAPGVQVTDAELGTRLLRERGEFILDLERPQGFVLSQVQCIHSTSSDEHDDGSGQREYDVGECIGARVTERGNGAVGLAIDETHGGRAGHGAG